jgi:hypothetical protein
VIRFLLALMFVWASAIGCASFDDDDFEIGAAARETDGGGLVDGDGSVDAGDNAARGTTSTPVADPPIASCTVDGALNGDETAPDCGGSCPPCAEGSSCKRDPDCASGVCSRARCAPSACRDGEKSDGETDVDCGGSECGPCDEEARCKKDRDCAAGRCHDGRCRAS